MFCWDVDVCNGLTLRCPAQDSVCGRVRGPDPDGLPGSPPSTVGGWAAHGPSPCAARTLPGPPPDRTATLPGDTVAVQGAVGPRIQPLGEPSHLSPPPPVHEHGRATTARDGPPACPGAAPRTAIPRAVEELRQRVRELEREGAAARGTLVALESENAALREERADWARQAASERVSRETAQAAAEQRLLRERRVLTQQSRALLRLPTARRREEVAAVQVRLQWERGVRRDRGTGWADGWTVQKGEVGASGWCGFRSGCWELRGATSAMVVTPPRSPPGPASIQAVLDRERQEWKARAARHAVLEGQLRRKLEAAEVRDDSRGWCPLPGSGCREGLAGCTGLPTTHGGLCSTDASCPVLHRRRTKDFGRRWKCMPSPTPALLRSTARRVRRSRRRGRVWSGVRRRGPAPPSPP